MATFKLNIAEPSTGRCFQKEVTDAVADKFIGLNIGETIKGDDIEFPGYEFTVTGGSDDAGFPMRRGILGRRKRLVLLGGVGFRGDDKGIKRRKTVCGHKINENIVQVNLKVTKQGSKSLIEILELNEADVKVADKKERKRLKAEEKKKAAADAKKQEQEKEQAAEEPKEADKPAEKVEDKKEEAPKQEKPKDDSAEKKEEKADEKKE